MLININKQIAIVLLDLLYIADYVLSDNEDTAEVNKESDDRESSSENNEGVNRVLYILLPLALVLIIIGLTLCYVFHVRKKSKKATNEGAELKRSRVSTDTTTTRVSSYQSIDQGQYINIEPAPPSIVEKTIQPTRSKKNEISPINIGGTDENENMPIINTTTPGGTTTTPGGTQTKQMYRSELFHFTTGTKQETPPGIQYNVNVQEPGREETGRMRGRSIDENVQHEPLFDGELEETSSIPSGDWPNLAVGSRATLPLDRKLHLSGFHSTEDMTSLSHASSKSSLNSSREALHDISTSSRKALLPIDTKLQANVDARRRRSETKYKTNGRSNDEGNDIRNSDDEMSPSTDL